MAHVPREHTYRPAWWVPGPHAQTSGESSRVGRPRCPRASNAGRRPTAISSTCSVSIAPPDRPRLFLLHGLEGTIRSHYVSGLMQHGTSAWLGRGHAHLSWLRRRSRIARARFYHSGETTDLAFALDRVIREFPAAPILLCGVSLGGNVLLKWLGERGDAVPGQVRAAVAISVPFDLERGSRHISRGFLAYLRAPLPTHAAKKGRRQARDFPRPLRSGGARQRRTLYDFDDAVTGPVHGFRDAHDYYMQSSSLRFLGRIRRPTLLLSARDDPFLPAVVLDEVEPSLPTIPVLRWNSPSEAVTWDLSAAGYGARPTTRRARAGQFFAMQLEGREESSAQFNAI